MTVVEPDYVLLCQMAIEERFDALLDEALKEGWSQEVVVSAVMELANAWYLDRSSDEDSLLRGDSTKKR